MEILRLFQESFLNTIFLFAKEIPQWREKMMKCLESCLRIQTMFNPNYVTDTEELSINCSIYSGLCPQHFHSSE